MYNIVHFQVAVPDPEEYMEYYSDVFGWKFELITDQGYRDFWDIDTGDECGISGSLVRSDTGDVTTEDGVYFEQGIINVIEVPDIDERISQIEIRGGVMSSPKVILPNRGYAAFYKDPTGVRMGIFQSDRNAKFSDRNVSQWG